MEKADVFDSRWNYQKQGPFQASTPSLAPKGGLIVFDSARTGNGDIYAIATNGAGSQSLIGTQSTESDPVFTWDGETIVFARQTSGYQHVWMYHLREKSETQLTTGRVIDVPVSSSTNGIVFRRTTFYGRMLMPKSELFEIGLRLSDKSTTRRFGAVECVSPDGERVVRKQNDETSGQEYLWITSRDGSKSQRIGKGSAPDFSRDGRRLVYLFQTPDFKHEVMLIDTDGTNQRRITTPAGYKTAPRFCLGGNAVCFRIPASPRDGPGGAFIVYLDDFRSEKLKGVAGEPFY